MAENESSGKSGAYKWVQLIGWQIIAVLYVICIAFGIITITKSHAKESQERRELISNVAQFTKFMSECLPTESKQELQKLVKDWTDYGIREGRNALDSQRNYSRRYEEPKKEAPREEKSFEEK